MDKNQTIPAGFPMFRMIAGDRETDFCLQFETPIWSWRKRKERKWELNHNR